MFPPPDTLGVLALAAALFVTPADAQDDTTQLPLPPAATVDAIQPDPPPPEEAAAPPPPAPPPSPEESLDEAAEALVQLLAASGEAGPPMAECAIDLLRTHLATAVEGDDVLTAIALENELLELCKERQLLVLEVLTTELLLASMVAGETLQEPVPEAAVLPAAALAPAAATLDQLEPEAPPPPVEEPVAETEPPPPSSPGFSWVTVLGSAGNLRAAVTDGTAVWWIREGDELAGGWHVTRVSAQPPGVTLSHAESGHHALPFHSGPAAGTDEP